MAERLASRSLITMLLTAAIALGSAWIIFTSAHTYCEERPQLTVLATLAAFLMALCFRQFAAVKTRAQGRLLGCCLAVAALTLLLDARVVIYYGHLCTQAEKDLQKYVQPAQKP